MCAFEVEFEEYAPNRSEIVPAAAQVIVPISCVVIYFGNLRTRFTNSSSSVDILIKCSYKIW
jgi:hypothetical protein